MSVLSWALYALVVSLLLGCAAVAAEAALRALRRSGRWPWVVALAGSVLVPLYAFVRPESAASAAPLLAPMVTLPAIGVSGAAASSGLAWLPWLWPLASGAVLLLLLGAHGALMRARRTWRNARLEATDVWVSRATGPAVFGVVRPAIVVPEWLLSLDVEPRRLMLLHEEQHRAAGDSRLLAAALLLCAVLPWNPLVWWQVQRLRAAMELDCDERVLARAGDPVGYGRLLIEVGRRRSERHLALAAFAEPRVLLERRVRALLRWPGPRRPLVATLAGFAAVLLFGWACAARDPLAHNTQPPVDAVVSSPEPAAQRFDSGPQFTPMTVRPELQNAKQVQQALIESYPPLLRSSGIGGSSMVWFFIDESGRVAKTQLSKSSGFPALDEAALKVAQTMQFTPGENRGRPVPVWVEIPIVFGAVLPSKQPGSPDDVQRQEEYVRQLPSKLPVRTQRAEGFEARAVTNAWEIQRRLIEAYPPLLRDAGIGGETTIAFLVDGEGRPVKMQVWKSSGHVALDEAALKAGSTLRFEKGSGEVWVQVPLKFEAK